MFSLICAWINGSVNNGEAGDLRRYRAHYDVIVMIWEKNCGHESINGGFVCPAAHSGDDNTTKHLVLRGKKARILDIPSVACAYIPPSTPIKPVINNGRWVIGYAQNQYGFISNSSPSAINLLIP